MLMNTLNQETKTPLRMNDIARIVMKVQQPLVFDAYSRNRLQQVVLF